LIFVVGIAFEHMLIIELFSLIGILV